jgi:diguanylate cyclase (GGDEF)-like protein
VRSLPRFRSIRSRILFFAVIAALVPSDAILMLSYTQNRRARAEKIAQELRSESAQTARAMGVWLKERLYDLRVFANSHEVSDQLGPGNAPNSARLTDYLVSLHERFGDFARLAVVDLQGRVVASSSRNAAPVKLATEWSRLLRAEGQAVGEPYWDEHTHAGTITVAVPVKRFDGRLIGGFTADLNLAPFRDVLHAFVSDSAGAIFLMTSDGTMLASSREVSAELTARTIDSRAMKKLEARERDGYEYRSADGDDVIGTLTPVPQVHWSVVAEMSATVAFEELRRYGHKALLVVVILLVVVAASAYWLGIVIARPLDRLTQGAAQVAGGNLMVDLPVGGAGEIGYLTKVFNDMVSRLRDTRRDLDVTNETLRQRNEELERLSVTDVLTGLSNRRNLMQRLNDEIVRSNRTEQPVSVLMADVDNFKAYNDANGHPAGDAALKEVAAVLRKSTRASDCVARYGGEEFCLILPVTDSTEAELLAERIRSRVAKTEFPGGSITLSLGVASVPEDGKTSEAAIEAADAALYQAKRDGRNRVVRRDPK